MKMVNIKGTMIFIVMLLVLQFSVGMLISPLVGPKIVDAINRNCNARISIGSINVWPLTLSFSINDLKIFDPDKDDQRIAFIKKAGVRLSVIGILSKRFIISKIVLSDADIDVKTDPDAGFNIQKIVESKDAEEQADKPGIWERLKGKKDWFSKIYKSVTDRSGKEDAVKENEKNVSVVKREVQELPRGRRVAFKSPRDEYVFQVRSFVVNNSRIKLIPDKDSGVTLDNARVVLKNLAIDPFQGAGFDVLSLKGRLTEGDNDAGNIMILFSQGFKGDLPYKKIKISAKDVDLDAVSFLYKDSLPVSFSAGMISVNSNTSIEGDKLESVNSITLKGHKASPLNNRATVGVVPLPMICDALNQVDPAVLKFDITGTTEKPKFENFMDSLMSIIKPYLKNAAEGLKNQAKEALSNLFKKKE